MLEPRTRQERIMVEILSTLKNIEALLNKDVSQETPIKKKKEVKK